MGNLVLSTQLTLDGFIDHTAMIADEELHRFSIREIRQAGAILFGRANYQLFERDWPPVMTDASMPPDMVEFAHVIHAAPKIVFSRTLPKAAWNNTTLRREVDPADIADLKAHTPGDLVIASGAKLARHMIGLGLVDEYKLFLQPVVLGEGLSLFQGHARPLQLTLLEKQTFASGVVFLHYRSGPISS